MFGYRKMYIGGSLVDGFRNERYEVICPANEEVIAEVAWAGAEDAQAALEAAQKGFCMWSRMPLLERKDWMLKLREAVIEKEDVLREAVMYEMGKTWVGTEEDHLMVVDSLAYYADEMMHLRDEFLPDPEGKFEHRIVLEPIGVVLAFVAWNFPLLNLAYKVGPILAAGCSLILEPSPLSPLSAYIFAEICAGIGFPPGVINILCGPHETVSHKLVTSTIPGGLTLIGSTRTGTKLIGDSATSIKHYSMELGGNAPVIVFEDADIDEAVDTVAALKFGNTGQICVAPNRIFLHKKIAAEFTNKIIGKAGEVNIGFGRDSQATMGPLVSEAARERVTSWVNDAISQGAELLFGGKIPDGMETGYFYEPTVLRNVEPQMQIYREEIFGPVVALIEFEDDDQVLENANDTSAGLASYLFTRDQDRIQRFSNELNFGEVQVNGFKYNISLPHIGIRQSGIGCDCSHYAIEDYMVRKRITQSIN